MEPIGLKPVVNDCFLKLNIYDKISNNDNYMQTCACVVLISFD